MKKGNHWVLSIVLLSVLSCTPSDPDRVDTPANRKGFEHHVGMKVPDGVSRICFYADEFGADVAYQLAFRCDKEMRDSIISHLGLSAEIDTEGKINIGTEFPWWDKSYIRNLPLWAKTNQTGDYFWLLWYDEDKYEAYLLCFSI